MEKGAWGKNWDTAACPHWPALLGREEPVWQSKVLGSRRGWGLPNCVAKDTPVALRKPICRAGHALVVPVPGYLNRARYYLQ